ncbi:MAG: sugar phosphate isomerase/epimerase [Clostridiales bacterium]|nr:sugar phosphate isomerase/epimerase [Clostridiales bacterium]
MNRKCICIGNCPGANLEEKLANAKAAGFAAVEMHSLPTDEERAAAAALYKKYGLVSPSIMGTGAWQNPATSNDPEVRARSAKFFRDGILTAKALGADTLLVVPGAVNPETSYVDAWKNSREVIESVIPFAAEHKIYLGIENVWNKFLLSSREMAQYIDSFNSEWVKAYFDVGNILLYGYPQHWINELGSRIVKVHIKGFKRANEQLLWVNLLEGDIDWKAVMKALRNIGFNGYLCAELGADERGIKGIADDMDYILSL